MKIKDLRLKTEAELQKILLENKKRLMNLRIKKVNADVKNTSEIRVLKRGTARIKTLLAEKIN